ncbi:carboxypeptidase-like regulatory domain-containing protein [Sphingobacterium sp. KU25419]|nr:carboxypeptidase-like regulatory domain-containing protein [Sphingobacterium sp. KU25419]
MVKNNYSKQRSWSRLYVQLALLTPLSWSILPSLATAHPLFSVEKGYPTGVLQQHFSGKVVDATGRGVGGVTVKEKGAQGSTSTDMNGKYTLSISSSNPILIFSSVGYISQEVAASSAAVVTLLQQEDMLDEVVVVGYGSQKKTNLTSAVSQIDAKVLQNRPSPTVVNMLQGAAPGLVISRNSGRPGAQGLNMEVRGATSANGGVAPLVVIDGVISSEGTFMALIPMILKISVC